MPKRVDWLQTFRDHGIPFVERGANVKRGNVNIQCPFCGAADPSHHMGVDLETGWWGCWRNNQHRGKSPLRLFTKLLNLPYWKAKQLLGIGDGIIDPDGFDAVAARIMGRDQRIERMEQVRREFLDFPREFEAIRPSGTTLRFFDYLAEERRFDDGGALSLGRLYDVCCAKRGDQAGRVILPYFVDRELVAWTGRAIGQATIRYKDLSLDDSLIPIKETLFNHDAMIPDGEVSGKLTMETRTWLIVVEGPMDALKVDLFGREHGVRAVALSTNSISEEQIFELEAAADYFDYLGLMLDNSSALSIVDNMRMRQDLGRIPNLKSLAVPYGRKDAALLRPTEANDWAIALTHGEIA